MGEDYVEKELKLKIMFTILGIGSLCSMNAILSEIAYFTAAIPGKNVQFTFILFNCILGVVFQLYLVLRGNLLTYKIQVIFAMILSIINLMTLPFTSYYIAGEAGYIVTSFVNGIQGFANAVIVSGLYGITAFLPSKYMVYFNLGQSVSGIVLNIIGFSVYGIFDGSTEVKKQFEGALIYFIITSMLIILNISIILNIYNDKFFIFSLRKSGEFTKEFLEENNIFESNTNQEEINKSETAEILPTKTQDFVKIIKTIPDLIAGTITIYLFTFIVFPGAWINGFLVTNFQLNSLIVQIIYNTCDLLGRLTSEHFAISRMKAIILSFLRIIPLVLVIFIGRAGHFNLYPFFQNKAVIVIIFIIFAFTNGYCTVLHFIYGPAALENRLKGKAASFLSLSLVIGIFIGSMIATFAIAPIVS